MSKTSIKKSLLFHCTEIIQTKVMLLQKMMSDAQASANKATKSSAGDKFETSRAMMQAQRDQYAKQFSNAILLRTQLSQIDPEQIFDKVQLGSVVKTPLANYFISISAGRLTVGGEKFYAISPQAPLAKLLLTKSTGDKVIFNNKAIEILEVF